MRCLTSMTDSRATRRWAALAASAAVLCGASLAQAQRPEPSRVRGTVERLTTAPKGETDGAVLDDGTTLHWPPHLADEFQAAVKVGDEVEATGRTETAPGGEEQFEVERLTNLRTKAVAMNDDRRPPKPPKGPKQRGPRRGPGEDRRTATIKGVVRSLTTAPKGEVDGAVLDDGTTLHWPPHLEDEFKNIAVVGDQIEATGDSGTGKRGEARFEVLRLTNLKTNASAESEPGAASPPRPRPDDVDQRLRALEEQVRRLERKLDRLLDER